MCRLCVSKTAFGTKNLHICSLKICENKVITFNFKMSGISMEDFFAELIEKITYDKSINDTYLLHTIHLYTSDYCRIINSIICNTQNENLQNLLIRLYNALVDQYNEIKSKLFELSTTMNNNNEYTINLIRQGSYHGRPKYNIQKEQITFLRNIGLNWERISKTLGISTRTLYRHRQELLLNDPCLVLITDIELDNSIRNILSDTPNSGEVYVIGALRARGIRIPRWRVRERLQIIDPIGRIIRRRTTIHRRVYNVKGPNYLW